MSQQTSIVEATIEDLSGALASNSLTAVELVAKYLLRITRYDCRNTALNAIPLLNERVFEDAAAADDRRAEGRSFGVLDGIPYTVKDSYKVDGMTVASGSEAFQDLIANEDAFVVGSLRQAGAILLGKTNMCPMAYGGMIRGLYGRAESPYSKDYLAAAFASGSSNGSGAATAASFASFGMGEETVSSGRSPASNNGLVAYTPSRGYISIRGNWPLYPTCDVIVPHTRTVGDLLHLLNVITVEDEITLGDFWRDQPLVSSPKSWAKRPSDFTSVREVGHLKGKCIAVPRMYIAPSPGGPYVSDSVTSLWEQTRAVLELAGANVKIIDDFPVLEAYETPGSQSSSAPRLPDDWNATERGRLIAHAWEDFLSANDDPKISTLTSIESTKIFPHLSPSDPQLRFTEPANMIKWSALSSYVSQRSSESSEYPGKSPIYDTPDLKEALQALEAMRRYYFEDWLKLNGYDYVAFPAAGDVGRADSDIDVDSAEHAWRNGVKYSHGNRMLRHLGIPGITVSMGTLEHTGMPMGLTILGKGGDDTELLKAGWCYEQAMRRKGRSRPVPGRTPPLQTDLIPDLYNTNRNPRPKLEIQECLVEASAEYEGQVDVSVTGTLTLTKGDILTDATETSPVIEVYVDGVSIAASNVVMTPAKITNDTEPAMCGFHTSHRTMRPPRQVPRDAVDGKVARDSTMVMVLARFGQLGKPSGFLRLFHDSDVNRR